MFARGKYADRSQSLRLRFLAPIAALFLLSACQTQPVTPIVQTITVEKPVQVLCKISPVERPAWETERANAADPVTVSRAIRAEIEQRRGYEAKLEAAQQVCQ